MEQVSTPLEDYKFGKVYTDKIAKEDALKFATLFGEGSKSLTNLIEFCILNDISTMASCKGHPEDRSLIDKPFESGYITFMIDDYDLAYFLCELPSKYNGLKARIDYESYDEIKTVSIDVPATRVDLSDKYFDILLEELKKYLILKQNNSLSFKDNTKKIVNYELNIPTESYIEVSHNNLKKFERNGNYYKMAAKCPSYQETNILHKLVSAKMKDKQVKELLNSHLKK